MSAGPGAPAPARDTRRPTCASRTGSPVGRWASSSASAPGSPPRPSLSGLPSPRPPGPTAVGAQGGPGAAAAKVEARRRKPRTPGPRHFRFGAVSAHLHPHIRTRPSASEPTLEPVAPKQFRYNPAPIIESHHGVSYAGRDDVVFQSGDSGASRAQAPQLGARRGDAHTDLRD